MSRLSLVSLLLALSTALSTGCISAHSEHGSAPRPAHEPGPFVVVLGTAQDGGLPQIGCQQARCRAARSDPRLRRSASSIAIVDPRDGRRWLIDAGPDLREQLQRLEEHAPRQQPERGRPALFEGIFLTHAHIGHYLGLAHLGKEAYASSSTPLYASPRMCAFLEQNGPWSLMVEEERLELIRLEPGASVRLAADLSVTAIEVPHREEFSDTLAFVVSGPSRSLLYLPDIDKWERWQRPIEQILRTVDVALLDGTFFEDGEIPGRNMKEIAHPFIQESLQRFGPLPASERAKVLFTHLNHTNPASDPRGRAARRVRNAGMGIAGEGQILAL